MAARPPFSGDGTRPIPRPPDRDTASAYEYVTGRSKPAALSGTRQPRGDPMASSRFRLKGAVIETARWALASPAFDAAPSRNGGMRVGCKSDAIAFDAEVRRRARTGDLRMLGAGRERLDEFA